MFISPAHAQAAGGAAAADSGLASIVQIAPLVLIFVVFYFLMIRPQQRRMKSLQASVQAVKKGDSVVTAGGLVGKVTRVEEQFVEVEIAPSVKVKVVKATIAEVTPLGGAKPAND
jgi:preprotein translocase subunit YajC